MARKEPPIETIMKALSKECERRKEMTKVFYATVEVLKDVDEFLEIREKEYERDRDEISKWLEEQKGTYFTINEDATPSDFEEEYKWKYKTFDEYRTKAAIIADLRTKLPKLAQ